MKNEFVAVCLALLILVVSMLTLPTAIEVMAANEDNVRDVITPTNFSTLGITQSLSVASGDGHYFINTNNEIVIVENGYTATITLTVVTGGSVSSLDIEDVEMGISAGEIALIGPFPTAVFNQSISGEANRKVYLNFNSAVTGTVANSVTLNVYRMP
jgi:hypothetical protein